MANLFDREIFKGILGNLYFWIALLIGGGVIAFFNSLLASDSGLPYYQVGLIFAATFALIGFGAFGVVAAFASHRRKKPDEDSGQRGIVNTVRTEANPHNEFKPSVTVPVTINQSQTQQQRVSEPPRRLPVFDCRGARIVRWCINLETDELIKEEYHGGEEDLPEHIKPVNVALARFYYRPDEGADPWLYLTVHIFIYDSDNQLLKEIFESVWNDPDNSKSMEFRTAQAHELIAALIPYDPLGIIGYEYGEEVIAGYWGVDRNFKANLQAIEGKDFRLKMELIAKRNNEFRRKQSFQFALALEPELKFVEIKPPLLNQYLGSD